MSTCLLNVAAQNSSMSDISKLVWYTSLCAKQTYCAPDPSLKRLTRKPRRDHVSLSGCHWLVQCKLSTREAGSEKKRSSIQEKHSYYPKTNLLSSKKITQCFTVIKRVNYFTILSVLILRSLVDMLHSFLPFTHLRPNITS